jgi:hypothetical protein
MVMIVSELRSGGEAGTATKLQVHGVSRAYVREQQMSIFQNTSVTGGTHYFA